MKEKKKFVIITGVAGGIGEDLAKTFNIAGYTVIGIDIKSEFKSKYVCKCWYIFTNSRRYYDLF